MKGLDTISLIPGITFAKEKGLSGKEMEALLPFLDGTNWTRLALAEKLGCHKTTLNFVLTRLSLKGVLDKMNTCGVMYYSFSQGKP